MDKRILNFMLVAAAVLFSFQMLNRFIFPPEPPPEVVVVEGEEDAQPEDPPNPEAADPDLSVEPAEGTEPSEPAADPKDATAPLEDGRPRGLKVAELQPTRIQLGSLEQESRYRMLVTLNTTGATIERAELKSLRYRDIEDRSPYWGHLSLTEAPNGAGATIGIVGPGTPADDAGMKPGDIITKIGDVAIAVPTDVTNVLAKQLIGDTIDVTVSRDDQLQPGMQVTLTRRPLEVMRPETKGEPYNPAAVDAQGLPLLQGEPDPMSLLMTLQRVGDKKIGQKQIQIPGVDLYKSQWWIVDEAPADPSRVTLARELPELGVQVIKRYQLAELPADQKQNESISTEPAYHLTVTIELKNIGEEPKQLAYRLEGPTGLPKEGWWYSARTSRNWMGGSGARDVLVHYSGQSTAQYSATTISKNKRDEELLTWGGQPLAWAAVDAQYFAAALIPQKRDPEAMWLASMEATVVSDLPTAPLYRTTNVTFRLVSEPEEVEPGAALTHEYVLFAGPKITDLLKEYAPPNAPEDSLEDIVYYGWTIWAIFSRPMAMVLHFFNSLVHNYGLAIIMLTVLVRGCMFPISRKQAMNAQKMQELQPEMKKISEKYKNDYEKRAKAMQDLQRKHNYNPLAGCLPMFIQLPIFIGLYRALMIDVELRDAPLISENFGWATNLGAPDMLFFWEPYLPAFLAGPTGWLGPYLNVLPLITVVLFLWQQKMFMPPPADDQAAMQQKVMRFMMIFMGLFFFKVASGLCLYFIASSLWGITERKLLPKTITPKKDEPTVDDGAEKKLAAERKATQREKTPAKHAKGSGSKTSSKNKKRRQQKGK